MRVLIADDEATSRLVLKGLASKLGHECLVAEDGSTAWELLCSRPIDVLLTDWMMPGMHGLDLCRRVRSEDEAADHYTYVVLTTGLDHPEQVLEGMSAGADDYLTKPVDPFAVQRTLVAAERVTELHARLARKEAELQRLNLELLERSLTDELTGLGNRRRMQQDIEHTYASAVRSKRAFGVALFDIDYFKLYNDHYGHVAGDEILRRVAATMDQVSRAGECVYRYGGEEFLLLVPDCRPLDSVYVTAERIRQAVADEEIPHEARQSEPRYVTVSGGVACWRYESLRGAGEVIEQADRALFDAKSGGKNQIQTDDSLMPQLIEAVSERRETSGNPNHYKL